MAGVEQCARDDADRIREVDDPRICRGTRGHALGELEHHRHGPHRLGEAAGARRLLADAPAAQRHRLVAEPRLLPADADLDEHECRALEGGVEIRRAKNTAREARALQHPSREPAHDLEPIDVDVVQGKVVDAEA